MTHLSPRAIEGGAKADALFDGRPWGSMPRTDRERYLERSKHHLTALEAEGMVVVPKATFYEIANRASNMCDPDAAEWMPSIYKIACEAVGEDPTRLLQAAQGGDDAGQ